MAQKCCAPYDVTVFDVFAVGFDDVATNPLDFFNFKKRVSICDPHAADHFFNNYVITLIQRSRVFKLCSQCPYPEKNELRQSRQPVVWVL